MLVYFLVAISPLIISYFFPKLNVDNKVKKRYLISCSIVLILFIGLRSKYLGSEDSFNYYNHMKQALLTSSWESYYNPEGFETGFQIFIFLLSRVFTSSQILFVATGVIFTVSISYCFYKNSDNVVLSLVMYITLGMLQFQMQGMRQAIAMAICLFSFEVAKKKKILPFILLVLLASLFHRTSIVFIFAYFIPFLSYNLITTALFCVASVFLFANSSFIVQLANVVFKSDYVRIIDSGGFVATAIYVIILIMAMVFYRKDLYKKDDKTASTIFYITFIAFANYLMRYFGVGISERISFYFMFGQTLLLPNAISYISNDYKKATTIGAYVMCILLFLYRLYGSEFVPYRFFWQ